MNNLSIRKLIFIDGYDAGKNGNLLVALVDKVTPTSILAADGIKQDVEVLICTATITESKMIDRLESLVDLNTPCNRLIVVSDKFLNLNKKYQLALLELESVKVKIECENPGDNVSAIIQAEVSVMEKFGKFTEWLAVGKARRFRESSEREVATGLHSLYKEKQKELAKAKKYGYKCKDSDDMDYREVREEDMPKPKSSAKANNDPEPEPAQ